MLGIEGYGSDADSDSEISIPTKPVQSQPKPKRPKKITIGLPDLPPLKDEYGDLEVENPPSKKPRIGAGSSSLLSMLPAPKQKTPLAPPQERTLGAGKGPGLVFNTSITRSSGPIPHSIEKSDTSEPNARDNTTEAVQSSTSSFSFLPPSVSKGKSNISLEDETTSKRPAVPSVTPSKPAVDFFSLGITSKSFNVPSSAKTSSSSSRPISAAPEVPTFELPEPKPTDPYPGYYQLPSGSWAAYDTDYYEKFMKKWKDEYDAHVRALEKGQVRGFEGYEQGEVENIDAAAEMEKAKREVKEREERKAITKGAGGAAEQPKMKISASKLSGIARSRHQLSTLLKEAYENREALEERIAEGRRNRKEAGNKYGF
ncbi:mitotic checkpoint regulator, MAD2B-interacting-domain-containing protein [Cyathus striatus]|nr:mitotic checkpoint regulator, MAD2B-interacting-domain-containing protein [Cyathus striatus]